MAVHIALFIEIILAITGLMKFSNIFRERKTEKKIIVLSIVIFFNQICNIEIFFKYTLQMN